jgi:hypothetical protein
VRLAALEPEVTTLHTIAATCAAILLALGTLYRLMRPKPPPAPDPAKDARDAEKRADDAIDRKADADVAVIEQRHEAEVQRDPVDVANDVIRKGAFVLVFALALPAAAEDFTPPAPELAKATPAACVYTADHVVCTKPGFARLMRAGEDAGTARDACAVRLTAANEKRAEAEKRIALLESLPPPEAPSRWPWFAGGVGVGVLVTVALVVAVK